MAQFLTKSTKYKYARIKPDCQNTPRVRFKWIVSYPFVTYEISESVIDERNSIEILPRPDLDVYLFANRQLELKFSNFYKDRNGNSKFYSKFISEGDPVFQVDDAHFKVNDTDIRYIYRLNRYTRIYPTQEDSIYLSYSEKF